MSSKFLCSMTLALLAAVQAPAVAENVRYYLPAAAHAEGVGGTTWRTDLHLYNPSEVEPATANIVYVPYGQVCGTAQIRVTVQPRGFVFGEDIAAQLRGSGGGFLRIEASAPLVIGQRTYNQTESGSLGQYVPATEGSAGPQYIAGMLGAPGFRTNLGLVNLETWPVSIHVDAGSDLGLVLAGRTGKQLNRVDLWSGFETAGTSGTVRASGRVLSYASVVDSGTGDPTFYPGAPPLRSGVVAGLAHAPGRNETAWRSDLVLFAPEEPATFTGELVLFGEPGTPAAATLTVDLALGETRVIRDVIGALLPGRDAAGVMWFSANAAVAVAARTYTSGPGGSFGQNALVTDRLTTGVETAFLLASGASVTTEGFRTNLCVVNGGEVEGTFTVSLADKHGGLLGLREARVPARSAIQQTDIVGFLGVSELDVGVVTVTGDEPMTGYLSVIDNRTGDASTVPAVPVHVPLVVACGSGVVGQSKVSGTAPLTATLVAEASGGVSPMAVDWDFDDGSPHSFQWSAEHIWNAPGSYSATVTVTDAAGAAVACTVEIEVVESAPEPVIVVFEANPTAIQVGEQAALVWQTKDATTVTVEPGLGAVPASGSRRVSPQTTTDYTLRAVGPGGQREATVRVMVNHPPQAVADTATTRGGVSISIPVVANDSDPDGDPLSAFRVTTPAHGVALLDGDAAVYYLPQKDFVGTDTFAYEIRDGRGGFATADVTVTVEASPNQAPVAVSDTVKTAFGVSVVIQVLGNDSDPDGDVLSISAISLLPTNGTVEVLETSSAKYLPADGFSGMDSFDYQVSDGRGGTATATVTVTVGPRPISAHVLSGFSPPNTSKVKVPSNSTVPFSVHVDDPDNHDLTWAVEVYSNGGTLAAPMGGRIGGGHGTISFVVKTGVSESGVRVVVVVSDSFGGVGEGEWTLDCL